MNAPLSRVEIINIGQVKKASKGTTEKNMGGGDMKSMNIKSLNEDILVKE